MTYITPRAFIENFKIKIPVWGPHEMEKAARPLEMRADEEKKLKKEG